jgi:alpha-D-ribose 1-methylphosphonate 5-triphosphate synthase subunit PhnG
MKSSEGIQSNQQRQKWMSVLARADFAELERRWQSMSITTDYTVLRPAEIGMVMLRGRVNGNGSPFNMGEATVTRCSIKMESGEIGSSYILGRNKQHAELAALIDGELLRGQNNQHLADELLNPLDELEQRRQLSKQNKAAKTKVDFFTFVRGEDD